MLGRRGGDLSGGQQQQLAIGRACCCWTSRPRAFSPRSSRISAAPSSTCAISGGSRWFWWSSTSTSRASWATISRSWTAARSSIPAAVTQWTRRRCGGRWPFEADDQSQPANARPDPSGDMSQAVNKLVEVGVVLQGGGALGAYECGALNALLELIDEFSAKGHRVLLKVVSGVSIGSINAACWWARRAVPTPATGSTRCGTI